MTPEKTIVLTADTAPLENQTLFDSLYDQLSEYRQNKVDTASGNNRYLSLAVGVLLMLALEEMGVSEEEPRMSFGPNGKPSLTDYPNIHFSLSHSGSWAMCIASTVPCGCDVEGARKINTAIADRYFHSRELADLNSVSDESEKQALFLKYWTMKESFLKATGKGLSIPLSSFSVDLSTDPVTFTHKVNKHPYIGFEVCPDSEYCYSICLQAEPGSISSSDIDFISVNLDML